MIKFLLDQNLSPKTAEFLRNLGWEAKSIREVGKSGATDAELYHMATIEGWIFVTFDLDFARRFMLDKALPGLIILRVHPQTLDILHLALEDFLNQVKPEQLKGSIATVAVQRYRLRSVHS